MSKEMITAMSAAQRLALSVAEVEALWKEGKLKGKKEFSQLYIEKESLYAYSGLQEGKQTGGRSATKKTDKKSVKNENVTKDGKDNDSSATMAADDTDEPKKHKPKESSQTRKATNEATKGATASKDEAKSLKDESVTPSESTGQNDADGSGDKILLDKEMSLDDVMKELFPGINHRSEELRNKALGKCKKCEVKYNEHDMKEVADVAYKMGKLAVYESMSEFKRKKPEKLVKRKARV